MKPRASKPMLTVHFSSYTLIVWYVGKRLSLIATCHLLTVMTNHCCLSENLMTDQLLAGVYKTVMVPLMSDFFFFLNICTLF